MTTEQTTERDEARERYCTKLERQCRERDHDPNRQIDGLPRLTRSGSDYASRPEIRREW